MTLKAIKLSEVQDDFGLGNYTLLVSCSAELSWNVSECTN